VALVPAAVETFTGLGVEGLAIAILLLRTGAYSSTVFSEGLKEGPLKADAMLDFETVALFIDALTPSNAV